MDARRKKILKERRKDERGEKAERKAMLKETSLAPPQRCSSFVVRRGG